MISSFKLFIDKLYKYIKLYVIENVPYMCLDWSIKCFGTKTLKNLKSGVNHFGLYTYKKYIHTYIQLYIYKHTYNTYMHTYTKYTYIYITVSINITYKEVFNHVLHMEHNILGYY